jgi:hypothetical protein
MEPNPFLRSAWYVAAWEDEISPDALFHRLKYAFEHQDKPIIIAQQEAVNGEDFWELKPLIFAGDAGAIRARRILRKLILAERGTPLEV